MSQQLYFSTLRTASPYPINRIEIKDGQLDVQYEKDNKVLKKSVKLEKSAKENLEVLLAFAKSL